MRSCSIRKGPFSRRYVPSVEAFGERKTLLEWSKDPRCKVKYGTLANRIAKNWNAEEALSNGVDRAERKNSRPQRTVEAFGERKTIAEWSEDPRVVVAVNVFLRRIQHGWTPEASMSTPVSAARTKRESNAVQYVYLDESKTLREWAQDERCQVSEMTLRKNLASGMEMAEAFQYRRKPGRHFVGSNDEVTQELTTPEAAVALLKLGGELWVYVSTELSRISLIYDDVRYPVSADAFQGLLDNGWISKVFETDTIRNFELTSAGKSAEA